MTDKKQSTTRQGEGVIVLVLVLAMLSVLVSSYLNHLHYKVHTDSSFSSICAISQEVNCETVALSPYSVFLGIPISWWGIVAGVLYLVVASIALLDLRRSRPGGARGWGFLTVMSVTGVTVSAILFYVAHVYIKSLCPFCMAIYVLQLVMAATIITHLVRSKRSFVQSLKDDVAGTFVKPALAAFLVPAGMVVGAYVVYPMLYDTSACPTETEEDLCTEPLTYGKPDARVRIVEYSDYECPFCAMTHFALRKAVENYPDDVVLVHVHFPLDKSCNDLLTRPFHKHSCEAARASVCAERQDRFWDLNDWLYTHQKRIGREDWSDVVAGMGMDVDRFEACMQDITSMDAVIADIEKAKQTSFVKQGNVGTPIIYIGDKGHMGAINYEELEHILVQQYDLPPTQ